jgi:RsiW-degrading membrane proteinase PrsW (M82 family)
VILDVTFAACAVGAAVLVYGYDLYDREPLSLLGLAAALGAVGMKASGWLETVLFRWLELDSVLALAFLGASCEETSKLLVVALFAVSARSFNDPMDGLIYGSMAGLGAAFEEGIAVLHAIPNGAYVLPPDELVRLCGHLVMGGIGGFGMGCLFHRRDRFKLAVAASLFTAVLLHLGWDLAALRAADAGRRAVRDALLAASLMLAGMLLYGRLVVIGSRWSMEIFSPGRPLALPRWPWSAPR